MSFVLEYIVSKGDASNSEKVVELLFQELPEQRGEIMTIAEAWEQEGAHKANIKTAERLLAMGTLEPTAIAAATALSLDEVQKLATKH